MGRNDTLKFDISKLEETKEKCVNTMDDLTKDKDQLIKQLDDLQKGWQTPAGKKFFEDQNDDWAKQIDNYVRITEGITSLIEIAINQYQAVIDEAKNINI